MTHVRFVLLTIGFNGFHRSYIGLSHCQEVMASHDQNAADHERFSNGIMDSYLMRGFELLAIDLLIFFSVVIGQVCLIGDNLPSSSGFAAFSIQPEVI